MIQALKPVDFTTIVATNAAIGVAHKLVVEGVVKVPGGWRLDPFSNYWLPPEFIERTQPEKPDA